MNHPAACPRCALRAELWLLALAVAIDGWTVEHTAQLERIAAVLATLGGR